LGAAGGGACDRRRARGGGGSPDLTLNGRPSSDSSTVCTRGKRAARATHLGWRRKARAGGAELAAAHGRWRRRQTRPGGAERERGREGARGIHNLGAKLSDGSGTAEIARNGGTARARLANNGGGGKLGFCAGREAAVAAWGVKGVAGTFYRGAEAPWRAHHGRAARRARLGLGFNPSPARARGGG
jgi:hypothetical protein